VHRAGKTRYLMTSFAAVVDAGRGELRYANAAQNFPYFLTGGSSGGRLETLVARGNTLGAAAEARFETHVRPMAPGQTLVLYSDGIVDAEAPGVGPFGDKRLRAALTRLANERAARIPGVLMDEVLAFTGGAELADDITLAAVGLADDDEDL
jgi:serine phosphatase RsbU (regulator of sigma subunit)